MVRVALAPPLAAAPPLPALAETVGNREGWPEEYLRENRETTDVQRERFARAVNPGVPLTHGTDAGVYPHGLDARQFAYIGRYGMTPMQALASATSEADLVAVGRNPPVGYRRPEMRRGRGARRQAGPYLWWRRAMRPPGTDCP